VTVLGRAARALETRSYPDLPDTYGQVGEGSWGQGMVWNSAPGFGGGTSQALKLSAVYACLRLLSEAISTLPLDTFYRAQGIRKPWRPRPSYLDFNPPQGSRIEYLSEIMLSLLTDGNAYIAIIRGPGTDILDLVVLDPTLVVVERKGGVVKYTLNGKPLTLYVDLLHIKGMCLPGAIKGVSPLGYARETIGLGLETQRFGSRFFRNNALPGAVIQAPGKFSDDARKRWRETWNADYGGENQGKMGVLTEGATLSKVSLSPEDSQFLGTRAFQVPDIARFYGVPPHLIADASNSTSWGSGLAEQNTAFGQFSLRPWCERIEEQHSRLLTVDGLPLAFVQLNMDALLRASRKERYEAYAIGIDNQIDLINECRAEEDKPPVAWGDEPFVLKRVTESGPAPADLPGLGPTGTLTETAPVIPAPSNGNRPVGAAK
jgi:HK97 family phage portal protein